MAERTDMGLKLKITMYSSQGGRKHNEDNCIVAYQPKRSDEFSTDLHYAYFGMFDGHGGPEASLYAKQHLLRNIVEQKDFWSSDDSKILNGIKDGFKKTHNDMWKLLGTWPRTRSGFPSTAGTTATIGFIKNDKFYVGHAGDSAIVKGVQDSLTGVWRGSQITTNHKPENVEENKRITQSGGKVMMAANGVGRVVWTRHHHIEPSSIEPRTMDWAEEVPFLSIARSLGDFWSYNAANQVFIVSPVPDCFVIPVDATSERCFIFGSDGLWDVVNPEIAVSNVFATVQHNLNLDKASGNGEGNWMNPSKCLVDLSMKLWKKNGQVADNTTALTVLVGLPVINSDT